LEPSDPSLNDYVFDNFEWSHCEGKIDGDADDDATTTYGGTSSARQESHPMAVKETNTLTVQQAADAEAETESNTASLSLGISQSSFSVKQVTIIMAVVICVVMLMTWIQFSLNIRDKPVLRTTA